MLSLKINSKKKKKKEDKNNSNRYRLIDNMDRHACNKEKKILNIKNNDENNRKLMIIINERKEIMTARHEKEEYC